MLAQPLGPSAPTDARPLDRRDGADEIVEDDRVVAVGQAQELRESDTCPTGEETALGAALVAIGRVRSPGLTLLGAGALPRLDQAVEARPVQPVPDAGLLPAAWRRQSVTPLPQPNSG